MRRRERELLELFRQRHEPGTDSPRADRRHERHRLVAARRGRGALRGVDLARHGRDRVRAHEPHPALALAGGGQPPRRAGWRRCSSGPEQTLNVVLLLVLVTQLTSATLARCAARGHRGHARRGRRHRPADHRVLRGRRGRARRRTPSSTPNAPRCRSRRSCGSSRTFAPLRVLSRGLIGVANVVLPGKGSNRARSSPRKRSARWPTSPPKRRRSRGRSASSSTRSSSSATPSCAR